MKIRMGVLTWPLWWGKLWRGQLHLPVTQVRERLKHRVRCTGIQNKLKKVHLCHWRLCSKTLQIVDYCPVEWFFHFKSCSLNTAGKSGWQAPICLLVTRCSNGRITSVGSKCSFQCLKVNNWYSIVLIDLHLTKYDNNSNLDAQETSLLIYTCTQKCSQILQSPYNSLLVENYIGYHQACVILAAGKFFIVCMCR